MGSRTPAKAAKTSSPKTGDGAVTLLAIAGALAATSALTVAALAVRRRRRD